MKAQTKQLKKADQYNDTTHNYLKYWEGRDYENESEEMAIVRLLGNRHFRHAVDVGGGFGRLCILLEQYAEKVTLAEPSQRQLDIAEEFLKDHPRIERKLLQAADLQFKDGSIDLLTMIRVMHHLPDPMPELTEIARVLAKDGVAIIEMANYAHARNRLKHIGRKMPLEPVSLRPVARDGKNDIPFVNHNPKTVIDQMSRVGLRVERTLSVSNLRSPSLKKIMPKKAMLVIEKVMQPTLASTYFGPSIFFLVHKD